MQSRYLWSASSSMYIIWLSEKKNVESMLSCMFLVVCLKAFHCKFLQSTSPKNHKLSICIFCWELRRDPIVNCGLVLRFQFMILPFVKEETFLIRKHAAEKECPFMCPLVIFILQILNSCF